MALFSGFCLSPRIPISENCVHASRRSHRGCLCFVKYGRGNPILGCKRWWNCRRFSQGNSCPFNCVFTKARCLCLYRIRWSSDRLLCAIPSIEQAERSNVLCYFLLVNHHASSLVIRQCSWMIKVARVHPNAGDCRRRPPRFFDRTGE